MIAFSKLIPDMEKNLVQEGCKPTAVQPLPPIADMCRLDEINACDEGPVWQGSGSSKNSSGSSDGAASLVELEPF